MKKGTKSMIYGAVSVVIFGTIFMSRFFGGTSVSVTHDFYSDNTYKVGSITVQETHSLPVRMTADLNGKPAEIYAQKDEFLSDWIPADVPFHALGISWDEDVKFGTKVDIYVRTKKTAGRPSEWIHVAKDNDAQSNEEVEGTLEEGKHKYYSFLRTAWSTHIQYKVVTSTENTDFTPIVSEIEFTYIDSSRSVDESRKNLLAGLAIMPTGTNVKIISRKDWGANEDLRIFKGLGKPKQVEVSEEITANFGDEIKLRKEVKRNDDGKLLTWPLQYPESGVKAIIIHHTASEEDAMEDSYAAMRAIYYYHTVTRGWGDIGYNFLIDEDGRIFEGRTGGDEVVGAHTANYNVGSVGVAIIGNYEEDEVKGGAVGGLIKILTHLAEKYELDPTGIIKLRGQNLSVISGHSDSGNTACPGTHVYEKMPAIRQLVKSEVSARADSERKPDEAIKAVNGIDFEDIDDRGIILLGPEEEKTITLRLRNTGEKPWSRNASLIYKNGNNNIAGFEETVARIVGASIGRGEIGEFKIPIRGSTKSGLKNYYLNLNVGDDVSAKQILFPVYIEPVDLSFRLVQVDTSKFILKKNESAKLIFTLENMGNVSWTENTVSLQSVSLQSIFANGRMISKGVIPSGGKAVFEADFKADSTSGEFTEQLKLSLSDGKGNKILSKKSQDFTFKVEGERARKQGEKIILTGSSDGHFLQPNEKIRAWIEVENNTNETWYRAGTPHIYIAMLKSPAIKVGNLLMSKGDIKPGETTRIYFDLKAPEKEGKYFVNFIFRNKNIRLTKKQMRFDFTVANDKNLDNTIRVLLPFEGEPIITSDSYFSVLDQDGKNLNEGINIEGGETVQISYENNSYILNLGNKKIMTDKYIRINSGDGILRLENFSNPPAWNPSLNDNEFRGALEVRYIDGALKVINELPLEHYLYGIGEVSNTDHPEKIKTIAVLARTYAKYYAGRRGQPDAKFPGKPYDLDASPDSTQKYLGYGLEKRSPRIKAGVDATRGEVVMYNGKIVKTPYFNATDGTATKSAEEVWGWTDTPYLISVPDPLCESDAFQGHGVGLSGCGAAQAANRGYSYKDIIKYYYKDISITDLY